MRAASVPPSPRRFWALVAAGLVVTLAGLAAAHYMEEHGHVVTGMNNQIVWGMPHVFAIFLIVAASGALNVASIGSVFGQPAYKPRGPLSALLCLALLAGGLVVLMLDLGRPERVVVAMTHYNFTSVFAWNMFLYSGMAAIVVVYLWTLMERRMARWSSHAGTAAFAWRIILTSGTGLDLRVPRRATGLRHRDPRAAVPRDVVRLGPRGVSAGGVGALPMARPARHRRRFGAGCRTCSPCSSWPCSSSC